MLAPSAQRALTIPALQMKQRAGKILNVGSTVGVVGTPFAGAYCGTKAAVEMLSRMLSRRDHASVAS